MIVSKLLHLTEELNFIQSNTAEQGKHSLIKTGNKINIVQTKIR